MEAAKTTEIFLDRVRKKHAVSTTINGLYLVFALLVFTYLLGNLASYYGSQPREYLVPFILALVFLLGYVLFPHFRKLVPGLSRDEAALLAEKHYPELKNSLINSWQLQRHLVNPEAERFLSLAFVRETVRQTSAQIEGFSAETVISQKETNRSRNILLAGLILTAIPVLILPDFFSRGYNNLTQIPAQASLSPVAIEKNITLPVQPYVVEDIRLKLNYPAYMRMPSETLQQAEVHAFPGTEVRIQATSNRSVQGAELILHGSNRYSMTVKENLNLAGNFMVKDQGYYQFGLKVGEGSKVTLPVKHPITLKKDEFPKVSLFPSHPKPVYYENDLIQFFYEGNDDFGIGRIALVASVNGGTTAKTIFHSKASETAVKGNHTWNLREMAFEPGDEVQYYLEAHDNDNVTGPKSGVSEIFAFTIFDTRKELENLIALQDELVDKMIILLAQSLVRDAVVTGGTSADRKKTKDYLAASTDQLIEIIQLAQKILDQNDSLESFPESFKTFFENLVSSLNMVKQEQIDLLNQLGTQTINPTPVGYRPSPVKLLNDKLVGHLEQDILFLVKISNRQKLGQVMEMKMQLAQLAESLKSEFENIRDKKAPLNDAQLKQKIQKIQQILERMIQQLARQTQGLPEEFINSKAFESLNMNKLNESLDQMMKMVKQGQIDNALDILEEMTKDLNTLARQLDEAASQMEDLVDAQLMEKLNQVLEDLFLLEKEEKKLLEDTTKIHQSLKEAQFKKFENGLKEFFSTLKKDVNEIQSILKDTAGFLDKRPELKVYVQLLDRESRLNLKIQELGQETVDSSSQSELPGKFKELRETQSELAKLNQEKNYLYLKTYDEFRVYLPDFLSKYDALEELAELYDLEEFNSLFKNTYPDTFRWQHNLRAVPRPTPGLSKRLDADLRQVRRLNAEISKKLGSMMVRLKEKYSSLISKENKSDLQGMSQEQNRTRMKTEEVAREFSQMSDQNPMMSLEFSMKMSNAGKYMKMAEKNLRRAKVPESIDTENYALQELIETREMLEQMQQAGAAQKKSANQSITKLGSGRARDPKQGGSLRMNREKINLPGEDQYQVPVEFRAEILKAMKHQFPKKYERFVGEYYKELIK